MDDMDDQERIDSMIEIQRLKNKEAILDVGGMRPEVNNQTAPKLVGDKAEALKRIAMRRSQAAHAFRQTREIRRE